MTELVVRPEIGLGPFELGMSTTDWNSDSHTGSSVRNVVQYIRANNRTFNKAVTKFNEQVGRRMPSTNPQDPLGMNICIDLVNQGVELRFNPVSQRLELIRVYDLTHVKLIYGDANFRLHD